VGETVDQTLNEIAATRAALERDIDELFGRLPEPAALAAQAKAYGAAAAGAAVVVGLVVVRARRGAQERARRTEARINAQELARAFAPQPPRDDPDDSRGGTLALLVAVAALVATVVQAVAGRRRSGD
jgi:hypothetical protein